MKNNAYGAPTFEPRALRSYRSVPRNCSRGEPQEQRDTKTSGNGVNRPNVLYRVAPPSTSRVRIIYCSWVKSIGSKI